MAEPLYFSVVLRCPPPPPPVWRLCICQFIHSVAVSCIVTCEALPEGPGYSGVHSEAPPLECAQREWRVETHLTTVSDVLWEKDKAGNGVWWGSVALEAGRSGKATKQRPEAGGGTRLGDTRRGFWVDSTDHMCALR